MLSSNLNRVEMASVNTVIPDIFRDFFKSLPSNVSPRNAPRKGPTMMPQGVKNKPTIIPMFAPHVAFLPPPALFAKMPGATQSMITAKRTTMARMTVAMMAIGEGRAMQHSMSAARQRGGPGNPGTTEPIIPTMFNTAAIIKSMS